MVIALRIVCRLVVAAATLVTSAHAQTYTEEDCINAMSMAVWSKSVQDGRYGAAESNIAGSHTALEAAYYNLMPIGNWTPTQWSAINQTKTNGDWALSTAQSFLYGSGDYSAESCLSRANHDLNNASLEGSNGNWDQCMQQIDYAYSELADASLALDEVEGWIGSAFTYINMLQMWM